MLVGYRWYDARRITPLFPFGFGLTYTSFAYKHLSAAAAHSSGSVATATIEVTNTGSRAGADVPQLYIADPAASGEPPKQLKGFDKVTLVPRQSRRVSFSIDARALSHWSTAVHDWRVTRGCYELMVGHDERDISQQATVSVNGASCRGSIASIVTAGSAPSCGKATGRLAGSRLGPARIGATRARTRRAFARFSARGHRYMDFFCLAGGSGIRVGYASPKLVRHLGAAARRRVAGRAVLALTANRHYALHGVRPGSSLARARRALRLGRPFHVGRNTWYLVSRGAASGVLKVRGGRVREVGLADRRLTAGRVVAGRFLRSFS
jgi:hypothetical protein